MTEQERLDRRLGLDEYLSEEYGPGVVHLDGPEFDGGIVGITHDGRLVYSYAKLAAALAEANGWTAEDAVDWIEFNTMRTLPYIGSDAPVVMYDLDPNDFVKKSSSST